MFAWLNAPWFFGLIGVSGIAGMVGSFLVFLGLLAATGMRFRDIVNAEWFYTGFLTGVIERFFFSCTIGLMAADGNASAIVGAMMAWIAIKGQVHYRMFSDQTTKSIPQIYLGLLGSLS